MQSVMGKSHHVIGGFNQVAVDDPVERGKKPPDSIRFSAKFTEFRTALCLTLTEFFNDGLIREYDKKTAEENQTNPQDAAKKLQTEARGRQQKKRTLIGAHFSSYGAFQMRIRKKPGIKRRANHHFFRNETKF